MARYVAWLLGAVLAVTAVPLLLVLVILPFAGRVALAFQSGADAGALAASRVGAVSFLAAAAPLSGSTNSPSSATETAKVTGGGTIFGQTRNFGFVAQGQGTGCDSTGCDAKGHLNYVNHDNGVHINGNVTRLFVEFTQPPGAARTTGNATFSGTDRNGCTFIVQVEDNGEPGVNDKFGLDCSGETTSGKQILSGGNIQIHPTQAP